MRSERQMHSDAYDIGVHMRRQHRLCFRRRLRLRDLHRRLRLEQRLPTWLCVRGRGLRPLHIEQSVRFRFGSVLPRWRLLLFDAGGLRARTRLPHGDLRRLPVWRRLRTRAGVHLGGMRCVLDVRRLQRFNLSGPI